MGNNAGGHESWFGTAAKLKEYPIYRYLETKEVCTNNENMSVIGGGDWGSPFTVKRKNCKPLSVQKSAILIQINYY